VSDNSLVENCVCLDKFLNKLNAFCPPSTEPVTNLKVVLKVSNSLVISMIGFITAPIPKPINAFLKLSIEPFTPLKAFDVLSIALSFMFSC